MNCFLCAAEDRSAEASGVCPVCGAGLCLEHRSEHRLGPGGTAIGCRHRQINVNPRLPDSKRGAAR